MPSYRAVKKRSKKLLFIEAGAGQVRDSEQKFFGSFFQKRTFFSAFLAVPPAPRQGAARMALSPLHRVWRAFPPGLRRGALARASAALAPRPDAVAPVCRGGIGVGGEIFRASGLGEGARLMAAALELIGVPVWIFACELALPGKDSGPAGDMPPPGAALVLHVNSPVLPAALLRLKNRGFLRGRRVIGYWAWELPMVPDSWRVGLPFVHEIWTPSRFSAAALERIAPGRVRVVPHPVAAVPPKPASLGRADFGLPEAAIIVLVSFSLASSFVRKNPVGAIAAFREAFGDRADRILLLKISHADHAPADFSELRAAACGAANIRFETRMFSAPENLALTQCADIVLSLHRSEGFGLVPAEAMCLGRAVVATDFSGTTDFLDAGCGMPIPYRLIPARDPRGVFEAPGAMWAEADIGEAARALAALATDSELRARLGQAAQVAARQRLGSEKLAEAVRSLGLAVAPPAQA
jgi:glycosyltransferase involved in cell wall biosynthesis